MEHRDPLFGEDRDIGLVAISAHGWVGTLGRQAGEAMVLGATGNGSETMEVRDWRRRIMQKYEIG
jgi:hypothetical protein